MKNFALSVLRFLNFLSFDDTLSWTNIALVGCVVKFWTAPVTSYADLAGVLVAVGNYAMKRTTNQAAASEATTVMKVSSPSHSTVIPDIEDVRDDLKKVKLALGMRGIAFAPEKEPKK